MAIERSNYFARRFESALNTVPDDDKKLVEAHIRVLEPATAFYRAQRQEGFYGNLTPDDGRPSNWNSPHTLIRSNGGHRVYGYGEIEPYKSYLKEIANRMDGAIKVAIDTQNPAKDLIEATLKPRAQAFRNGKLVEAMILGLNTRLTPRYHLFIGLLDRYLDPQGFKLVMQGWLQRVDAKQNRYYNELANQITGGAMVRLRIIYGDMLAAGGMTVERPWSGNTVPSEDDIRNQVGADSYVFPNNIDESARNLIIPAVERYVPQVTKATGWKEMMYQGNRIALIGHEAGHAVMPFDKDTINLLGGRYMAIKELLAELFAVTRIAKLPRSVVSTGIKQLIYARSLARWRNYVNEFNQETDPDKKAIIGHYTWAGIWRTNYQERGGGVKIDQNGTMEVPDWDKFVDLDDRFYQELTSDIDDERHERGFVERRIQLNSRKPKVYIENGQGHNISFPQIAVA